MFFSKKKKNSPKSECIEEKYIEKEYKVNDKDK